MSTTSNPFIPIPIRPENEAEEANAPDPDSERAEALKARHGKKILKEGSVPLTDEDEPGDPDNCDPQDHA